MSSRNRPVVLSPLAETDFEDILLHTLRQWDESQAREYGETIRAAFQRIATHPLIGQPRDDMLQGLRTYLIARRHLILYEVTEEAINVLRIVHVRMDSAKWLRNTY